MLCSQISELKHHLILGHWNQVYISIFRDGWGLDFRMESNRIVRKSDFVQECKQERKIVAVIRCPVCHRGKLLDATEEADTSAIHLFGSENKNAGQWYIKCPKCGKQIGIAFGRTRRKQDKAKFVH